MGLLWCAIAGLGFGTNYLPVKSVDAGDGVFFTFCMSIGIMFVGCVASFAVETEDSAAFRELPRFEPYAMLGGVAWMLGNLMCPLIIKWIGLGLGLTVWDLTNMIMGWATGYFGLFNVRKELVRDSTMNLAGVVLAVISLFFFVQARDVQKEPQSEEADESKDEETGSLPPLTHSDSQESDNTQARNLGTPKEMRWFLGFAMAVAAGILFGYTFDPAVELAQHEGHSSDQMDFVWSSFAGIVLTGNIALVIYVMVRGEKSYTPRAVVWPAIASGAIWGIAQIAWFKANEALSLVVAFPIVSSLPGIIGLLLGVCCLGELKTRRARLFAGLGVLVRVPGIILIALSGA